MSLTQRINLAYEQRKTRSKDELKNIDRFKPLDLIPLYGLVNRALRGASQMAQDCNTQNDFLKMMAYKIYQFGFSYMAGYSLVHFLKNLR